MLHFFFSSRRRHTRWPPDWSSDVCSSDLHGLTRRFDGRVAVEDLNVAIPEGTVFGFLGPNGAGKTTTVRLLAALIAPSAGDAIEIGRASCRERVWSAVGG